MNRDTAAYTGRFAPSPTGPLHAGSLVAALASWLDARAAHDGRGGRWLVRIEDVDTPRCAPGAAERILSQLAACGLVPDEPPWWQSARQARYQQALDALVAAGRAYPCGCSRRDIEKAQAALGFQRNRHVELPYPGTCRHGLQGRPARSWRFHATQQQANQPPALYKKAQQAILLIANDGMHWTDRRLGRQYQDVARQVGDFVLRRADGLWAYQLAVVVDDADQGVTHIVRGEDLADNTPRQLLLQQALGVPHPTYMHMPLVRADDGEKLSKQHGAPPVDVARPLEVLRAAARVLGLPDVAHPDNTTVAQALAQWVLAWRRIYNPCVTETPSPLAANGPSPAPSTPSPQEGGGAAPADVAFPKTIRSYVRRAGRTTTGQAKAFEDLGPRFLLPYAPVPLDATAAFGRQAPLVLEIGFGMGEATAHIARVRPQDNFLCCEVHEPGVGALLKRIGEHGIENIRILQHDAVEVIDHMLPPGSLDGVHIFFPDPWHKKRHNKRRLIQPQLVAKLAARLKPGGYLHCATDWQPYAEQMLEVLSAEPSLENTAEGFAPQPDYRPLTKFENRGLRLGHGVWDVVFKRRD